MNLFKKLVLNIEDTISNLKINNSFLILGLIIFALLNFNNANADNKNEKIEVIKTHAISLTDIIKYDKDFKHFEYADPNAKKGGTFRRAMYGTFDSFNPFAIKGMAIKATGYMYDSLLVPSLDEPGTYYGLIAETIEYPTDYSYAIFHLRKNAVWHDKKALTADDVVFSFNAIKNVSPFYKKYYELIEKAEKIDKYTVKFIFKAGEASKELPLIAGQLTIIPKHYWKNRDLSVATLEIPLGSGPYKIKSYEPGKTVTFERVKNYWAENTSVGRGMDNFDLLIFEYFRDQTVAFEAFKAGQFDFIAEGSGKRWHRGYTGKFFDRGFIKKEEIHNKNSQGMTGLFFNIQKYPLNIKKVREALVYAFDYEWINKNIYFSEYLRHDSYFSNSELNGKSIPNKDVANIIKEVIGTENKEYLNELLNTEFKFPKVINGNKRENLNIAFKLLKEAGFNLKNGKMIDKKGNQMEIVLPLQSKAIENELMPFKQALEKLGVKFSILYLDSSQYVQKIRNKDYMLVYARQRQSESPGNEQRAMWGSASADDKASRNYPLIKNKAVDILVEKIVYAKTRKELIDLTQSLDKILLHEWLVIPFGYSDRFRIAYWDKFIKPAIPAEYNVSISSWSIDPKKEEKINKEVIR